MTYDLFKNKKVKPTKLLSFGFSKEGTGYIYSSLLFDKQFKLTVKVEESGKISTKVTEADSDEAYTLHLVPEATGAFIGKVKEEYEKALNLIAEQCFEADIFKSTLIKNVIEYAKTRYGDEPEYLWKKVSNNAILRRKDTAKWYAALLITKKSKLGLNSEETIEIIDLRADEEEIKSLIDKQTYFPAYHMNKKHWITISSDNSLPRDEIFKRLDLSYNLATK